MVTSREEFSLIFGLACALSAIKSADAKAIRRSANTDVSSEMSLFLILKNRVNLRGNNQKKAALKSKDLREL
jgi:hypothetical protein